MVRALAIAISLVAVILLFFWLYQRRMIYFPYSEVATPAQVGLSQAQGITFQTDDGLTLNGWFVPASAPSKGDAVIVFNGNAGNRSFRADLAAGFAKHGFHMLLFDYRGYGDNPGSPSEEGLALDAVAARRYLASRAGIDSRRISYFGESLGAAVAVRLALAHRPRALILRSPFTTLTDTARHHYPYLPVRWLLRDRYPSIDLIARVGCPVLVITAAHDSIVPSEQSRRLFEAAAHPKKLLVLEGVDHNDEALVAGPRMIAAVAEMIDD